MEAMLLALGSASAAGALALATGGHRGASTIRGSRSSWAGAACDLANGLGSRMPDLHAHLPRSARVVCDDLRSRAASAECVLDARGAAALLMLAVAGSVLAGAVLAGGPLGLAVGAIASCLAIPLRASALERERAQRLCREMPAVFRTLAVALGSGKTLHQAVDYVGTQERGLVAGEFGRASLRMRCGSTPQEALADLESRIEAPGMRLMTAALIIAQRTGSPLRDLFLRSARLVERQGEFRQMLEVKTAQVRLSVRVVSAMPAILVGLLSIISRDFQAGLASPVGLGCVCAAAALDLLAIYIIRHLMRGIS